MWVYANPNPQRKVVPDCVIRAVSIALNLSWYQVYDELSDVGRIDANIPSADTVWGHYLYLKGFEPFLLPTECSKCTTVNEFTKMYPYGTYIIGTGTHAVAVIDGNYYDTWDSGDEVPSFFWRIR